MNSVFCNSELDCDINKFLYSLFLQYKNIQKISLIKKDNIQIFYYTHYFKIGCNYIKLFIINKKKYIIVSKLNILKLMTIDKILDPNTLELYNLSTLSSLNGVEIQSLLYINHLYLYKKYRTKYIF